METLPLKVRSSGQALVLVLLGMGAILITVLSVIARSVTDISLTTKDDEAKRAFSAAEAGVEKLLVESGVTTVTFDNNSKFVGQIQSLSSSKAYALPYPLKSGEVGTFWFVGHDDSGNLTCSGGDCFTGATGSDHMNLCWGEPGTADDDLLNTPAIELSIYYDFDTATGQKGLAVSNLDYRYLKVARAAFDPSSSRRGSNQFTAASKKSPSSKCDPDSDDQMLYAFETGKIKLDNDMNIPANCIQAAGCLLFGRIKLLYSSVPHRVGVYAQNKSLPPQGKKIESVGTSGEATRKVEVIRTYSEPLAIFDAGIFSGGSIN